MNLGLIKLSLKSLKHTKILNIFVAILLTALFTLCLVICSLITHVPSVIAHELDIYNSKENYFAINNFLDFSEIENLYKCGVEHTNVYFYDGSNYIYDSILETNTYFMKIDDKSDTNKIVAVGQPIHYCEEIDVIQGESINLNNKNDIWLNEVLANQLSVTIGQTVTQVIIKADSTEQVTKEYVVRGIRSILPANGNISSYYNISIESASEIYNYINNVNICNYYVYCSVYGVDGFINAIDNLRSRRYLIYSEIENAIRDNKKLISFINTFLVAIFIITVFVFVGILNNINTFYINNHNKMFALYKSLGAKNKCLISILLLKNGLISLLSLICATLLSYFINFKVTSEILNIFSLNHQVGFKWYYPLILILVMAVIFILQVILLMKKLNKINLSVLSQEGM